MPKREGRAMIAIDPEVLRQIKVVASAKGMTVKALVEQAALEWCLAQPEVRNGKKRTRPVAVYF